MYKAWFSVARSHIIFTTALRNGYASFFLVTGEKGEAQSS
jgi:hypothetical protein